MDSITRINAINMKKKYSSPVTLCTAVVTTIPLQTSDPTDEIPIGGNGPLDAKSHHNHDEGEGSDKGWADGLW